MTKNDNKAAIIIIGNEILSGRIKDENTYWLSCKLNQYGLKLTEVRIVPDDEKNIIDAVKDLIGKYDYVFSTGGIGPTHDDVTTLAVAKAFGVDIYMNEEAKIAINDYFGDDISEAKLKMAYVPEGSKLIKNKVSGAPGFIMDNLYVFAGVPRVMQVMFDNAIGEIQGGIPMVSNSISCSLQETEVAPSLNAINIKYKNVEIGSYPNIRGGGLNFVLRSIEDEELNKATNDVIEMIKSLGDEPLTVSIQSSMEYV